MSNHTQECRDKSCPGCGHESEIKKLKARIKELEQQLKEANRLLAEAK